jgi:sugar/nucleoside kinase (ribokinase family)
VAGGDPTGCGDVWGMTTFRALLAGQDVEEAMLLANTAASHNVAHRGASGLNRFLRGEIEVAEPEARGGNVA